MTGRRWTSVAIAGTLTVAIVGLGVAWLLKPALDKGQANQAAPATVKSSPMRKLAEGIRQGDPAALTALCQQVLANVDQPRTAVGEQEGADLVEVLNGLRGGFIKFAPVGRASAVSAATHLLDRFRVEPAPASWIDTLQPIHDLVIASLVDPHVEVRSSALTEVGSHWNWLPGRSMTPAEESTLASWKDAFYEPAKRCLSDREPKSRAAAVVCIGALSLDSMAAPAAANVEYPENGGVRYRTLMTFANRPALLSVDTVLKRLHDTEPGVPELAEMILKGRGLTKEQIFLGKQIFNPHPEIRASVIPLIRDRTDIDPVVWLLELTHDLDETVRAKAVEALVNRDSPDVDRRLKEIASTDSSATIRATAGKHVARSSGESTASLPPLPGSSSLNPKAN
jgi:HEAT repeat protein